MCPLQTRHVTRTLISMLNISLAFTRCNNNSCNKSLTTFVDNIWFLIFYRRTKNISRPQWSLQCVLSHRHSNFGFKESKTDNSLTIFPLDASQTVNKKSARRKNWHSGRNAKACLVLSSLTIVGLCTLIFAMALTILGRRLKT